LSQSLADASLLPNNILQEYPVTISRSSLLTAFLATLSTSSAPSYSPLDIPGLGKGLEKPLASLSANFDQAVNVIGNLRYRDRRGKTALQGQQQQQESYVDVLKGLAAADGAAKGLSEAAGVGVIRAFGARAGATD
jgi:translation initiation factor 3 subunit H